MVSPLLSYARDSGIISLVQSNPAMLRFLVSCVSWRERERGRGGGGGGGVGGGGRRVQSNQSSD